MKTQNKRLAYILTTATLLLSIPFIAMQFSTEVTWDASDFLMAGILLYGAGLLMELIIRHVNKKQNRILFLAIVLVLLIIIWLELAVGIFGTPFAGN
ncbi:MAG: hypothetical protein ACK5M1_12195 [Xanthomarina gelatinilytica]|uniref:hypothetical protein n=1 Tax=Xanthomarina gelatinilytica TaxID=1137281 RepID=UPI003A85BC0A